MRTNDPALLLRPWSLLTVSMAMKLSRMARYRYEDTGDEDVDRPLRQAFGPQPMSTRFSWKLSPPANGCLSSRKSGWPQGDRERPTHWPTAMRVWSIQGPRVER